jgi:arylsulfatase A-like enzyme
LFPRDVDFYYEDKFTTYKSKAESSLKLPGAALLAQAVLKWLKNESKTPFFIWIHYFDPHTPYIPPYPYSQLYLEDKFYNPNERIPLVGNFAGGGGIPPDANLDNIQEEDYYISQYDGEIRYTDEWIVKLMNYLKKNGLYNNSLIIISADHGEGFGEHNFYFEHAYEVYDETIRIPLIIKFPKQRFKRKIIKTQVRAIDVMPSILDVLGIDPPENIDGISFLPLITNKGKYKVRSSFSKNGKLNAIRTEDWKLIYFERKK